MHGGPTMRMDPRAAQQQLQSIQQKMLETQDQLAAETLTVTAGGGAVTVEITGQQKLQSVKISPEVIAAGDVEMLQDLILAAVNEAIEKSQENAAARMSAITGGLGIPGLF
jgi:DNA-binding YbaB/EbfC family protein